MAIKIDPDKIRQWYRQGLWTAAMIDQSVERGALTKTQAAKIKKEGGTHQND